MRSPAMQSNLAAQGWRDARPSGLSHAVLSRARLAPLHEIGDREGVK